MKRREDLWDRAQRSLDRRRDPLADRHVQAGTGAEREDLELLMSRLALFGSPPPRGRRVHLALGAGAVTVGALVLGLFAALRSSSGADSKAVPFGSRTHLISVRMTSELRSADGERIQTRELVDELERTTLQLGAPATEFERARSSATLVAWTATENRP